MQKEPNRIELVIGLWIAVVFLLWFSSELSGWVVRDSYAVLEIGNDKPGLSSLVSWFFLLEKIHAPKIVTIVAGVVIWQLFHLKRKVLPTK